MRVKSERHEISFGRGMAANKLMLGWKGTVTFNQYSSRASWKYECSGPAPAAKHSKHTYRKRPSQVSLFPSNYHNHIKGRGDFSTIQGNLLWVIRFLEGCISCQWADPNVIEIITTVGRSEDLWHSSRLLWAIQFIRCYLSFESHCGPGEHCIWIFPIHNVTATWLLYAEPPMHPSVSRTSLYFIEGHPTPSLLGVVWLPYSMYGSIDFSVDRAWYLVSIVRYSSLGCA